MVRHFNSLSQSSPASIAAQSASKFSLKDAGSGGFSVSDVFSSETYVGGSGVVLAENLDLTNGGMAWVKAHTIVSDHIIVDSSRPNYILRPNSRNAEEYQSGLPSFSGVGLPAGTSGFTNYPGRDHLALVFRKYPGFFDMVTYSGNNGSNRKLNHNLGTVPGAMLVKRRTGSTSGWFFHHRNLSAVNAIELNDANSPINNLAYWQGTNPTDLEFTLGSSNSVNGAGNTYINYIFGHDPSPSGVIYCGSYTGNGSTTGPIVDDMGWRPQFLLIRRISAGSAFCRMYDNKRSPSGLYDETLMPVGTSAQVSNDSTRAITPLNTGFQPSGTNSDINQSGATYGYIAIRAEGA